MSLPSLISRLRTISLQIPLSISCELLVKRQDIPDMPVDLNLLDKLKARVQLARKIDTTQHRVKKAKHESNWMKEAAEAMELALDSDLEG